MMKKIQSIYDLIKNTLGGSEKIKYCGPFSWSDLEAYTCVYSKNEDIKIDTYQYKDRSTGHLGYTPTSELYVIHNHYQGDKKASEKIESWTISNPKYFNSRWYLKLLIPFKKEYQYIQGTLANIGQYDYMIAMRACHAMNHLAQYPQTSPSEYCAYLGFQSKRLAKSLLRLHDHPYVNYHLPDFDPSPPRGILISDHSSQHKRNDFFKLAYNRLVQIEAAMKKGDSVRGTLAKTIIDIQEHYWTSTRIIPNRSNFKTLCHQDLVEHIQYLAVIGYFEHLSICCAKNSSIYYSPPETPFEDKTLSQLLNESYQKKNNVIDQYNSDMDIIRPWINYWATTMPEHHPYEHAIEDQKWMEYAHVIEHSLKPRYTPSKYQGYEQQWIARLYAHFDDRLKNAKQTWYMAAINSRLQRERAGTDLPYSQIPRKTHYDQVPIKEQAYFANVVKNTICNELKQGLWQGIVPPQIHQEIHEPAQIATALNQQLQSPFAKVRDVASKLKKAMANCQTDVDYDFYANRHALLNYLPSPELTIEYKMLFARTQHFQIQHLPFETIPNFVEAIIQLYQTPATRFDQSRLRQFMADITQHQIGQNQLDVRNLLNKASTLYQRYSSKGQKALGWCLVALGATMLCGTLAIFATAFASPWLLPQAIAFYSAHYQLSQPTLVALSVLFGCLMSTTLLMGGKSCVSNRPFFQPKRFDVLRYRAIEIHPHFDYYYLTNPGRLSTYHSFYDTYSQAINKDLELLADNSQAFAKIDQERHWCVEKKQNRAYYVDELTDRMETLSK